MPPKLKATIALLAIASLAVVNGVHVVALQSIAWVKMYQEYSELVTASEALELTFSNVEICGICLAADEIREDMEDILDDFSSATATQVVALERYGPSLAPALSLGTKLIDHIDRKVGVPSRPTAPPPRHCFA